MWQSGIIEVVVGSGWALPSSRLEMAGRFEYGCSKQAKAPRTLRTNSMPELIIAGLDLSKVTAQCALTWCRVQFAAIWQLTLTSEHGRTRKSGIKLPVIL